MYPSCFIWFILEYPECSNPVLSGIFGTILFYLVYSGAYKWDGILEHLTTILLRVL